MWSPISWIIFLKNDGFKAFPIALQIMEVSVFIRAFLVKSIMSLEILTTKKKIDFVGKWEIFFQLSF